MSAEQSSDKEPIRTETPIFDAGKAGETVSLCPNPLILPIAEAPAACLSP